MLKFDDNELAVILYSLDQTFFVLEDTLKDKKSEFDEKEKTMMAVLQGDIQAIMKKIEGAGSEKKG